MYEDAGFTGELTSGKYEQLFIWILTQRRSVTQILWRIHRRMLLVTDYKVLTDRPLRTAFYRELTEGAANAVFIDTAVLSRTLV